MTGGHEDRVAVVGPIAAFAALGVFWGAWAALVPAVKEATEATPGELGVALLGAGIGSLPAMLLAGRLSDRFASRSVPAACFAFAVVATLPAFAESIPVLFATLLLIGAATGALDVAMNAAVAAAEATGRRLMNLAHAVFSLSLLVASASVGVARELGAGRHAILTTVALVLAAAAALNLRGGRAAVPVSRERGVALAPRLLFFGALCGLAFVVEGGIEAWSAVHLEETLGAGPAVGGLGPALYAGAMVTGRVLAQFAGERLSEARLMTASGAVAALGVTVALSATTSWAALVGFVLAGLGVAACAPTFFGLAGRAGGPGGRGRAISTVTIVSYLGFLVGPPLVGAVAAGAGLRAGLGVLAAAALALAVLSATPSFRAATVAPPLTGAPAPAARGAPRATL